MGGDRIRRVIILELQEEDGEVFEDFLSFLQDHPEIENCKQNKDSIISLPGLEIYPRQRRVFRNQQEIPLTKTEYEILIYLLIPELQPCLNAQPNLRKDLAGTGLWGGP